MLGSAHRASQREARTWSSNFGLFDGVGEPNVSAIAFPIVKARGRNSNRIRRRYLVRPMRRAVLSAAVVLLIGCASDRFEWSMAHLDLSPRARKLPRPELEQIVKLVVNASSSTVLAVGQSCDAKSGVYH